MVHRTELLFYISDNHSIPGGRLLFCSKTANWLYFHNLPRYTHPRPSPCLIRVYVDSWKINEEQLIVGTCIEQ